MLANVMSAILIIFLILLYNINYPKAMAVILGIESSCDETSASICIDGEIFSNVIATQAIHAKYGGVVP